MTIKNISPLLPLAAVFLSQIPVSVHAQQLQYAVKPEQVVAYRVNITADTPSAVETMKGVIAYQGVSFEGDRFTVKYTGGLSKSSKRKAQDNLRAVDLAGVRDFEDQGDVRAEVLRFPGGRAESSVAPRCGG